MKAIRVHIDGDQRKLLMEEQPQPTPGPGEVLVRTLAIGVNRADLGRGRAAASGVTEPFIPGLDVGGTIEGVGSQVSEWRMGDPVIALARGTYAEFVIARANMAYQPPGRMAMEEAASIPCVFLTAWYALTDLGRTEPGQTVLVHAAGSGVGTAGIQIAKALGARVLTSAGGDSRVARGIELGAEAGVNYSTQDMAEELQRLTGGHGVDVVLDPVGGAIFDATLGALAPGGRIVTIGAPAGARTDVDQEALQARGQSVQTSGVSNTAREDSEQEGWAQLKIWFEDGTLRPVIDRVLPWSQAEDAQRLLQDRSVFGKLVLKVD